MSVEIILGRIDCLSRLWRYVTIREQRYCVDVLTQSKIRTDPTFTEFNQKRFFPHLADNIDLKIFRQFLFRQ